MGDDNGGASYTVDEAIGHLGFGRFQALALCYAGIGYAAEAMEMMLLSFIGTPVQSEWKISPGKKSLITSVVFVGMLLGAYSWGIVSDTYGRRKGFLFTALVTGGAGFLSAFAPNYISLIIFRFVVGIGLGGGPVLLSWFLELVPAPNRGIPNFSKEHWSWNWKFSWKNRRDHMPACGCRVGGRMPSDCSHPFV